MASPLRARVLRSLAALLLLTALLVPGSAPALAADGALKPSACPFDRLADSWGVEETGPAESRHWFDVDTRTPAPSAS